MVLMLLEETERDVNEGNEFVILTIYRTLVLILRISSGCKRTSSHDRRVSSRLNSSTCRNGSCPLSKLERERSENLLLL